MKLLVLMLSAVTVVFYIGGVLAGASFNPFAWSETTRTCIASFWILIVVLSCVVSVVDKSINDEAKK